MNSEQQRVAIAEWCGWTEIRQIGGAGEVGWPYPKAWIGLNSVGSHQELLPDYLHDLNAIHEAEKKLTDKQINHYVSNMWRAMHLSPEADIGTIHATAAQRAEALLRTLNLWKD